jgi:hypothetical protein
MRAAKAPRWRSPTPMNISEFPLQLNLRSIVKASLVVIGQAGNHSPRWQHLLTAMVPRGGLAHV